jgi:hypothetical protein
MSKALRLPYSKIIGLTGLPAYALDAAVVRWGTAFDAAISEATRDAKNAKQAESQAMTVMRRWIPSTRQYR